MFEKEAEEYVKGLCKTCTVDTCRYSTIKTCAIKEYLKQAYSDGFKDGRPKWHKVTNGDLPDNTDNVLSDKGVIVYYNFTYACWVDERASVEIDDVIAWCEIPQHTEE